MKGCTAYLVLQATREGQASHAHVHEIINGLRQREWLVDLFEPSYVRADRLPGAMGRLREFLIIQIRLWFKAFRKIDIVYIRSHYAAFPTSLIAKLLHITVVQEVNGPYEDLVIAWPWTRRFLPLFKRLLRIQLKWANAVIVVTPQLKEWVQAEVGHKYVKVIPNGANANLFYPQAITHHPLPNDYVVFFGALTLWQGLDTLLKAVGDHEWPEELHLVIVGDGVERVRVEEAVARNPKVIYLGRLPYREVPGIVAGSLAGLSPQNNQGERSSTGLFPLKLFETLACGIPIVTTDFPGQADLVREYECGVVIPHDDPSALAQAVSYLYKHPSERLKMGRRGRAVIEQEHSWDKRASDTDSVLLQVLYGGRV